MTWLRVKRYLRSMPDRILGSHMPDNSDGITRLHVLAPTVTPQEIAKLEAKPKTNPVDYYKGLPVG